MSFWTQFPLGECYPKCGCEPLGTGLIMQPFAFWSSLAFALVAFIFYKRTEEKSFELKLWVGLLYYLTFASLFAHASYLKIALAMDFSTIVVLLSFFSLMNLFGLLRLGKKKIIFWLSVYVILLTGCFTVLSGWPRISLCVLIFFFALGDLIRDLRSELFDASAKPLWTSLGILFFSFSGFLADSLLINCVEESWVHGHTLWHIGASASVYYYSVWRFQRPKKLKR